MSTGITLACFEIWAHESFNADGTSEGDTKLLTVWCAEQSEADQIARAVQLASDHNHVKAYYEMTGVVRPE